MRFKDVFSIIGPAMIGPSSSHTAGAVRIGRVARKLVGELPQQISIYLYGSFAETYLGHGTNLALAGGLLDFATDDERIKHSLQLIKQQGVQLDFYPIMRPNPNIHPNTARIHMKSGQQSYEVVGCSIGGGNIEIKRINDYEISFSAAYPTLLIFHEDRKGMIALITHILQQYGINIGFMKVERKMKCGEVLTVIEIDEGRADAALVHFKRMPYIDAVHFIDLAEGGAQ